MLQINWSRATQQISVKIGAVDPNGFSEFKRKAQHPWTEMASAFATQNESCSLGCYNSATNQRLNMLKEWRIVKLKNILQFTVKKPSHFDWFNYITTRKQLKAPLTLFCDTLQSIQECGPYRLEIATTLMQGCRYDCPV